LVTEQRGALEGGGRRGHVVIRVSCYSSEMICILVLLYGKNFVLWDYCIYQHIGQTKMGSRFL
jgi:hypothetical protein